MAPRRFDPKVTKHIIRPQVALNQAPKGLKLKALNFQSIQQNAGLLEQLRCITCVQLQLQKENNSWRVDG